MGRGGVGKDNERKGMLEGKKEGKEEGSGRERDGR